MKKLYGILFIILCFLFNCHPVSATEISLEDIYKEQYDAVGVDELFDALPNDVASELEKLDLSNYDFSKQAFFKPENIFAITNKFIKSGCKKPLASAISILAILLFSSSVGVLSTNCKTIDFVVAVGITVAAVLPVSESIIACIDALKAMATFMMTFIPMLAALVASKGRTLTSIGFSSVALFITEGVNMLYTFVVVPLSGIQLSVAVSSAVMPKINIESISKTFKKISIWVLSLASTVLLLTLSVQTIISVPADNLTSKATKFIIGTAVPVVGSTVSEALNTVRGCVAVLSSSVAVYGVFGLFLIVLPIIAELFLWRVSLGVSAALSEVLNQNKSASLLRSADSAIAVVLGVMILVAVLFIISVTLVAVV